MEKQRCESGAVSLKQSESAVTYTIKDRIFVVESIYKSGEKETIGTILTRLMLSDGDFL